MTQDFGTTTQGVNAILAERETSPAASHLVRLWGKEWAAWRCVCVRGAGFPSAHVLSLGVESCAEAADNFIKAQGGELAAQQAALGAFDRAYQEAPTAPRRHDPLVRARQRIRQGKVPDPSIAPLSPPIIAAVEEFRWATERTHAAHAEYRRSFQAASVGISHAIRERASDELFREAVLWQNRRALHTGLDALLRLPLEASSSKQRQYENLIASYLQRYSVKNDTIGFFGPVGWAKVVPNSPLINVRPGKELLESRTVYFEGWLMDALVRVFGRDAALLPWIAPRRVPFIDIDAANSTLYVPAQAPMRLPGPLIRSLALCDGQRVAKQIAVELSQEPSGFARDERQVYEVLRKLRDRGLIYWSLEMPWTPNVPAEWHLEASLWRLVRRIEDDRLRQPLEDALKELEQARDQVTAAAGNASRLDDALEKLEKRFVHLTGTGPTRKAGQTYAGRMLVFEDCRRSGQVEISEEMMVELGRPLSLLLNSARWFTHRVAGAYRAVFRQLYTELVRDTGSPTVDGFIFWQRVQPLLYDDQQRIANQVVAEFQERWRRVLGIEDGARRVEYCSEKLRPCVEGLFKAPHAGWRLARYQSPDVMIAASSTEAIRRGDFLFVLGELHMAVNTMGSFLFLGQHPAPEELFTAFDKDIAEPRLVALLPKNWPGLTTRTRAGLHSPKDYYLELANGSQPVSDERVIPLGSLVVEEEGGELYVRTRDSRLRFEIAEALGDALSSVTFNDFKLLGAHRHAPRVTIDRLVVLRETWQRAASEMGFAFEKDEAERFVSARRWARELGVPRFAFVRVPVELKPFYVDFASPIYVELLAKLVRRTREAGGGEAGREQVTVSEMLPGPDEVWLEDAEGQKYTSELRIAALDLLECRAQSPRSAKTDCLAVLREPVLTQ